MEKTFATLSRTFRALAALERTGTVRSVQFWPKACVDLEIQKFKELFPKATGTIGPNGILYRAEAFGVEVTAWQPN